MSEYLERLAALLGSVALFLGHGKASKSFGHWRRHMLVLLPFIFLSDVNSDDTSVTSVTESQQF